MTTDIGGDDRFERLRFHLATKLLRNEGHRESQIGRKRWYPRLPLAAAERIVRRIGLHGLDEARAALTNAQAKAVAPQRPLRRVVIDGLEMFARALVARVRRDDGRSVEIRHAIGIDQKLELDLTGMRGSARPEWFRCRFRILRWRLIDHGLRDELGGSRCLKKPATTCVLLLSFATGFPSRALGYL